MKLLKDPINNSFTITGITEAELNDIFGGLGWGESETLAPEYTKIYEELYKQFNDLEK